ncbi:MAG: LysM peptidoglycan-binding domain-containing protein [Gammaproteobacteria bacterium]|nr:LysM peptidoglycan-binding domain-containing protein [Gammaproteobacteria bacterium]
MKYRLLALLFLLSTLSGCGVIVFPEGQGGEWRSGHETKHRVSKGETLYSIAYRYGIEYRTLAQWNNIKSPYRIFIGQQLLLKPHIEHKVEKGDTLYSIAFRYGVDYRSLAKINGIKAPYQILIGDQLTIIPQANSPSVATLDESVVEKTVPPKTADSVKKSKPKSTKVKSNKIPAKSATYSSNRKVFWSWPVRGKIITTFSPKDHRKGIDIRGKVGKKVVAADAGDVVYSGNGLLGYGNLIIIRHNSSYLSAYGHNRKLLVKEGTKVKRGEQIAEMGRSRKKGAILHFEIRRNGKPVNPLRYLPRT